MGNGLINGVLVTPLEIIKVTGGDVLHAMKKDDPGNVGIGEAYFSTIEPGVIKAWKRHREMTLNLVVPHGAIRFVVFDDRAGSATEGNYQQVVLSRENYYRLTVPPMVWMGFQGMSKERAIVLNLASILHVPEESDRKTVDEIPYNWSTDK